MKQLIWMYKLWRPRRNASIFSNFLSFRSNKEQRNICLPEYLSGSDCETAAVIHGSFQLYENFVSEVEEMKLIAEVDPFLKRRRYEIDHWDGAITTYKETEKMDWNVQNSEVLQRFCGDTIAGLSLLSSSIMRLAKENNKEKFVDVLLSRRSLYIMKGTSRYDFTHEILEDAKSYFKNKHVPRDRRVSIICRNEPS
ncbi:alpha-ketoglutarate-dependent dioxygenase alkB homolog 7, mitochondrial-like isoform X2 [Uloborus diversus]|uniref:alpha-ketoglutarate-dependent dioxygenase alkB homolog 7, mitochondrial-like isoform X2 n=1 Tax=Uloborus diversus TaxID=327109 RepID=UPI002409D4F6|nr:alpha-ketoglutarate-dependent dioxygenase alkB homolog 7, mitochondrial-like isoform X2 [Uloborus diversus]